MKLGDDLLIAGYQSVIDRVLSFDRFSRQADIVDPFEQEDVGHAGLNDDVRLKPRNGADPDEVAGDAVASDSLVDERDILWLSVGLHPVKRKSTQPSL